MDRFDSIAIITFVTCDAIIENIYGIKCFYRYYYKNIKHETKDIVRKLFH